MWLLLRVLRIFIGASQSCVHMCSQWQMCLHVCYKQWGHMDPATSVVAGVLCTLSYNMVMMAGELLA